jgi:predicted GIY-YIG superfamily endonuclease
MNINKLKQRYFIYCIKFKNDIVYIGSTNNFSQRKSKHKKNTTNKRGKLYWLKLYLYIRENGGINNFIFEILENGEKETKEEIRKIEQNFIDKYNPNLNSKKSFIDKTYISII